MRRWPPSLKSGKIAGAAIDVFPKEPESGAEFESALRELPNVILTPHVGGSARKKRNRILDPLCPRSSSIMSIPAIRLLR